jgi:hypothetical protein
VVERGELGGDQQEVRSGEEIGQLTGRKSVKPGSMPGFLLSQTEYLHHKIHAWRKTKARPRQPGLLKQFSYFFQISPPFMTKFTFSN